MENSFKESSEATRRSVLGAQRGLSIGTHQLHVGPVPGGEDVVCLGMLLGLGMTPEVSPFLYPVVVTVIDGHVGADLELIPPTEVPLESNHGGIEPLLLGDPHDELSSQDVLAHLDVLGGDVESDLVEESTHHEILHVMTAQGVRLQGHDGDVPFEIRIEGGALTVVEQVDGPLDGMTEQGEDPSTVGGGEEGRDLGEALRDDDVGQVVLDHSPVPGLDDVVRLGHVDVDVPSAVREADDLRALVQLQ
mmetsp:Transcript_60326/g.178674  ORF Transcript_60326/g.178674 Transcript_60326/m.178674 type:complete len:248 (-) Transcript_60326:159-902(-)